MKAKIKETAPEFKPVTLELTFETKEELYAMLAVANRANSAIWEAASECDFKGTRGSNIDAWRVVSISIYNALSEF